MEKRPLGRTGLEVGRLALGGLFAAGARTDVADATRIVARALDRGVNYIDTAPGYGSSEAMLGRCLADVTRPVVLSTKLGGRPTPFDPRNRDGLRQSLEESLRLLGRDCIDILMIHEPDRPGQYDWWTDFAAVDGPVLEVLEDVKRQGLVRFTGLGGTTAYELAHLVDSGLFDVVLTAFNYSLLWREAEHAILPAAKRHNVGVVVGSPLQQGALAKKYAAVFDESVYWLSPPRRRQFQALYALADELCLSLPELAIRFVVSNPDVDCVLMGAKTLGEVDENVDAVEKGPLPADVLARLAEIHAMVPFRPCEEPFGMGLRLGNPAAYKGPKGMNY